MELNQTTVEAALSTVIDPEIGLNIVDLGLIYAVRIDTASVQIDMTMTTPTCPMGDLIMADAEAALQPLLAGRALQINLVWEPAWSNDRLSPSARLHFGW